MTRGRKPLPRETLALRDTLRKDRERPSSVIGEPVPVDKVHERCQVSGLQGATERARKIYWATCRKVAAQGMLDPAFCQELLLYAMDLDMLISAEESIKKDGITIKQGKKTTTTRFFPDGSYEVTEKDERYDEPNPAVKMHLQLQDRLIKIGSNFGFDPVSRSRLKSASLLEDPKKAGIKAVFAAVFADNEDDGADEQ